MKFDDFKVHAAAARPSQTPGIVGLASASINSGELLVQGSSQGGEAITDTFKGAGGDMAPEQVLDVLRDASAKAIPANVAHEIRRWFDQCRRVAIRTSVVIHCPDVPTATRVLAAGGNKLAPISDTVVELSDGRYRTSLIRKLKESGVLVDLSTQPAVEKKPKESRRNKLNYSYRGSRSNKRVSRGICSTCSCATPKRCRRSRRW